jgi:thioredoxin reductase
MIGTVDLVITGDASAARPAALSALQHGQRVLVVLRSADARVARRLRRSLRKAAGPGGGHLRVMTSAEVVCADGVDRLEAVVIRHAPTGRLSAVNASAFVSFDPSSQSRRRSSEETHPTQSRSKDPIR